MGGGGRGVTILSHRPVTSSDLKQDRLFFRDSVSTFLQLVVALTSRFPTITRGVSYISSRVITIAPEKKFLTRKTKSNKNCILLSQE